MFFELLGLLGSKELVPIAGKCLILGLHQMSGLLVEQIHMLVAHLELAHVVHASFHEFLQVNPIVLQHR